MKIAIVAPSPVPFLIGGAEKLYWGLHRHMNQLTPHEVELIKVPCRDQEFWPLMEAYDRFSRLDLSYFDMVITTKYPAWMVPHKNHRLYMQHTCRGVYDLYHLYCRPFRPLAFLPTHRDLEPISRMLNHPHPAHPNRSLLEPFFKELFRLRDLKDLPPETFAFPGPFTRAVIRWLDRLAISPDHIKTYSAISRNVALREGYLPTGVDTNRLLVAQCRERCLEVVNEDALAYMRSLPDASIEAVTDFHIIEHLPFEVLIKIMDETIRVFKTGRNGYFRDP